MSAETWLSGTSKRASLHIVNAAVSALMCAALAIACLVPVGYANADDPGNVATASDETTIPATITSHHSAGSEPAMAASVTFSTANVGTSDPVRFVYNVWGTPSDDYMYYLFSLETLSEDGVWNQIVDISQGNVTSTKNYAEAKIPLAGRYRLTFVVYEYTANSDGTKSLFYTTKSGSKVSGYVRFQVEFEIEGSDDLKSAESIATKVADQCMKECAGKDDYAKALWLNDWIVNNTEYDNSLKNCSAYNVFGEGLATCEGYHKAYVMLLNKVGINTRRVDSVQDNHVWTGVQLDGKWYSVDTTWNDSKQYPSAPQEVTRLYFAVPNDIMQAVHTGWDGKYSTTYPNREEFDANSYADNYYIRSGKISTYTGVYVDSKNSTYGVGNHLKNKETSFAIPVEKTSWADNYKNIIYRLVAYQLGQENWGSDVKSLSATYDGADKLNFNVSYASGPASDPVTPQPAKVAIIFDANGGSGAPTNLNGEAGATIYNKWPTTVPVRSGYEFVGWYTEKADGKGTKVTAYPAKFPAQNVTYYAHWKKQSSSGGTSLGSDGSGSEKPSDSATTEVMYRMYNPNSGEHFYTAKAGERDSLKKAGWSYEGVAWTAPKTSNTPVYRLYSGTDHHYTKSKAESDALVKAGWKYEGIGWYSDDQKRVGLHRLYNPNVDPSAARNNSGSHHYTISSAERDSLVAAGWKYENIGWFGL